MLVCTLYKAKLKWKPLQIFYFSARKKNPFQITQWLCHYWLFKHFFCLHLFHILCQEGKQTLCVLDKYSPWNLYLPGLVLFRCKALRRFEKVRINCVIVCFQSSSGVTLNSLPEPFRCHRGWVSVKAQQLHDVVSFYLPSNHSLLLSAGEQR